MSLPRSDLEKIGERFLPMLDRHIALYGSPPRQVTADVGYANATISTKPRPGA